MISLSPAVAEVLSAARPLGGLTLASRFLVALNATGRPLYAGTVAPAEVARRRAANKVARRSRRVNRGR